MNFKVDCWGIAIKVRMRNVIRKNTYNDIVIVCIFAIWKCDYFSATFEH